MNFKRIGWIAFFVFLVAGLVAKWFFLVCAVIGIVLFISFVRSKSGPSWLDSRKVKESKIKEKIKEKPCKQGKKLAKLYRQRPGQLSRLQNYNNHIYWCDYCKKNPPIKK